MSNCLLIDAERVLFIERRVSSQQTTATDEGWGITTPKSVNHLHTHRARLVHQTRSSTGLPSPHSWISSVNRRRQSQGYHFWLVCFDEHRMTEARLTTVQNPLQSSPRNPTLPAGSCALVQLLGWLGTVLVWQWARKGLYSGENEIMSSLFGSCCTSWLEKLEFWHCGNCIAWIFASCPHAWGWPGFERVLLCEGRSSLPMISYLCSRFGVIKSACVIQSCHHFKEQDAQGPPVNSLQWELIQKHKNTC